MVLHVRKSSYCYSIARVGQFQSTKFMIYIHTVHGYTSNCINHSMGLTNVTLLIYVRSDISDYCGNCYNYN